MHNRDGKAAHIFARKQGDLRGMSAKMNFLQLSGEAGNC